MLKKIYYWFRNIVSQPEGRGEPSGGYWADRVRERVFNICKAEKGRILEVGCGEGLLLKKLINNIPDSEIFGIDLSEEQLTKAKMRLGPDIGRYVKLVEADATNLPFKDEIFSTVICVNVFINMPVEELVDKALQEIRRVSKRGAKIIFDIRNQLHPLLYLKYKLVKYYDATIDSSHLRMYKLSNFEEKLKSLGMILNRKSGVGFPKGKFAPIIIIEATK